MKEIVDQVLPSTHLISVMAPPQPWFFSQCQRINLEICDDDVSPIYLSGPSEILGAIASTIVEG